VARPSLGDGTDYNTFLGVAFPDDQMRVLPYNRIVKDIGSLTPDEFVQAVRDRFELETGPAAPVKRGDISMYFGGAWQTLRPRAKPDLANPIASLDVNVLQEQLLAPVLGIKESILSAERAVPPSSRSWCTRERRCSRFRCSP
jgi:uncharacterized protein (DUF1015 family)